MQLFPEFDQKVEQTLTMKSLELLFQDAAEQYGLDKKVDVILNPV